MQSNEICSVKKPEICHFLNFNVSSSGDSTHMPMVVTFIANSGQNLHVI